MKDAERKDILCPMELAGETEEDCELHRNINEELRFYRAVAAGNLSFVQENCSRGAFEDHDGVGQLSDDPVRNMKYHFVVTAAMITRFCVDAGMAMEESFRLSDSYIRRRKLDRAMNMLRFTDDELADIANQLAFSSQSHFIQQFRAHTGMTPKAFRQKFYTKNYDIAADEAVTEPT